MKRITKNFIVKEWNELTEEEKQKQIEKFNESIYEEWSEYLYSDFKDSMKQLDDELKHLYFKYTILDCIRLNENSQGWWIDSIMTSRICTDYETFALTDIEFKVVNRGKELARIEDLTEETAYIYFGNVEDVISDNLSGYVNFSEIDDYTKYNEKFKEEYEDFKREYNYFVDSFNVYVKEYFENLYDGPTEDFIDNFMEWQEFEYEEN